MNGYVLSAIGVSVACTLLLRALPFFVFTDKRPMPEWLKRLGEKLPMAIMAVLVIYCLKDAFSDPVNTGIPQFAGVLVVAITYKWKKNTLMSILLGTAAVMILMRIL